MISGQPWRTQESVPSKSKTTWEMRGRGAKDGRNSTSPGKGGGGRGFISLRPRVLHKGVANHVVDVQVDVFAAAVGGVVDDDDLLGDVGESAAFGADKGHGAQAAFASPGEGVDKIRGPAAHAGRDEDVARAGEVLQL